MHVQLRCWRLGLLLNSALYNRPGDEKGRLGNQVYFLGDAAFVQAEFSLGNKLSAARSLLQGRDASLTDPIDSFYRSSHTNAMIPCIRNGCSSS